MNIVGYVRVSTEEQARSGLSIDSQRERISAYAVSMGIAIDAIIVDAGKSAKDLSRPGMQRILAGMSEGTIHGVVAVKLDRLTRSVKDLCYLVEHFNQLGVALVVIEEAINTSTAAGRMVANVLGSISQWEREVVGERTRDALALKKQRGEKLGGTAPYGYKLGRDRKLAPKATEQQVIAKMRALRAGGSSFRDIAELLMADGIKTRQGCRWHSFSVQRVLEREEQNT